MNRRVNQGADWVSKEHAVFFRHHHLSQDKLWKGKFDGQEINDDSPYPMMLIQDIVGRVIPYSHDGRCKISLIESDSLQEERLSFALGGEESNLSEAVIKFVRQCAHYLMKYQEAIYDIVTLHSREDDSFVGFQLRIIPPLSVRKRFGKWTQYVPEEIAREKGTSTKIELSYDHLVVFRLPRDLKNVIKRTLKQVSFIGKHIASDFVGASLRGETLVRYDFDELNYSQKMAMAEATKDVGWNARNYFSDEVLEFYELDRYAVQAIFVANIRQLIFSTLNFEIARVASTVGVMGKIIIEGLPTLSDYQEIRKELHEGKKEFNTIFKMLS